MDKNIYDKPLQTCSKQPLTGFYRDGYCKTGAQDTGTHTVCGQIEEDFLKFSKKRGNNLYGVVKPGDHWCLCQERWNEAYESNEIMAPLVKKAATNKKTRKHVKSNILQQFSRKQRNILKKKGGKTKKRFLYHPNNPDKSFDVYIDKNPKDTISISYTTLKDVEHTIKKLEKLYKNGKYPHKRIWQVAMIMKVRLEAMLKHKKDLYPKAKNVKQRYVLANSYFLFLKERSKEKKEDLRKKMKFQKF